MWQTEHFLLVFGIIQLSSCFVCAVPFRTSMRSQLSTTLLTRWACGWCWPMKGRLRTIASVPRRLQPWCLESQTETDSQWREIWPWNRDMCSSSRYLCSRGLPRAEYRFFIFCWGTDTLEWRLCWLRMVNLFSSIHKGNGWRVLGVFSEIVPIALLCVTLP